MTIAPRPALWHRFQGLIHARDGRLTRELRRESGRFVDGQQPARWQPDAATAMVCGYCSTGCGLTVHLRRGEAVGLTPDPRSPVNRGSACPKGWEALAVLDAPDRATTPLLRDDRGARTPVSWEVALDAMIGRFRQIQQRHGPEAIAFLGTGQIATEELAFLGALAKFGLGMVHGDGNTRQCMASAVVAYKQSFGFDAPPYTYKDLEESDCLVLVGSNLCVAHPILWDRVLRNPHRPEIVVIDPRRTETAAAATLHLPIRPKTDLVLFHGLAHHFIRNGWIDRSFVEAHTSGFGELAASVRGYGLGGVAYETGLSVAAVRDLAERIRRGRRVSFWWTMGVNQSHQGVRTAQAIINLALLTGNIGRPGTGANSITGQCNAMGSRLFSNTASLLGGREFQDPRHRDEVARILEIPESRIPRHSGRTYDQILEDVLEGSIKGLWVVATNPAHSWIARGQWREARERLEFLVVQDVYTSTETAVEADLLLPAAAWGEKSGTFINSERRIGLIHKVRRAPGQALSDFHIFQLVAERAGLASMFARWTSPEAVFAILQRLSAGRPCDFTGIDGYRQLAESGGVQWPQPAGTADPAAERRLFTDGRFFHPDGRARLIFEAPRPLPEEVDGEFPFLLLTGRGSASQWHTETRTSKSAVLRRLAPRGLIAEIHPHDASRLGLGFLGWIRITSRRGSIVARAFPTFAVPRGQIFLPMHHPATNRLTLAAFDPYSRQPAYKACAVQVAVEPPPSRTGWRRLWPWLAAEAVSELTGSPT